MCPASTLLATLLFAISIAAASPVEVHSSGITLPLVKRISSNGGAVNVMQHAQARAAKLRRRATDSSVDITSISDLYYIASVGIGSPATTYNLIVDTGSSNIYIGGDKSYSPTKTSVNTHEPLELQFGNTNFTGIQWLDTVTLGPDLVVSNQAISVVGPGVTTSLPNGVDGTLGIGTAKTSLIQGNLINEPGVEIPTITHNLFEQGTISQELFSVFLAPATDQKDSNGEIMFGGIDSSKYIGEINYTPITSTYSSSYYWGFNQSITYGDTVILSETAGIADTGTFLILIATNALAAYQSATGAVLDESAGLLRLTTAQYGKLENLNFHVGSETYTLIPNAQIFPRSLNTYIGGSKDGIYSVLGSVGTPSGAGYDFIAGQPFFERFYSVYDATNQRIGFAKTKHADDIIN